MQIRVVVFPSMKSHDMTERAHSLVALRQSADVFFFALEKSLCSTAFLTRFFQEKKTSSSLRPRSRGKTGLQTKPAISS